MKSCLIVDDDADLRSALRERLEGLFGCVVHEAPNIWIAIEILKTETVSLIISDLSMPFGSGVDFYFLLQEREIRTPLIIFSNCIPEMISAFRGKGVPVFDKLNYRGLLAAVSKMLNQDG